MTAPSVLLARAAGRLSRGLGRGGGTSLPGKILLRVRPGALASLSRGLPEGVTMVSATNGKTTTSRMLAAAMRAEGWELVANSAGANLLSGVATALVDASGRSPSPQAGLFEVDEAALPAAAAQVRPRCLLLMNLFRDQLDRYGELEVLADRWATMIAHLDPETIVVLNGDDPAVAALGDGRRRVVTFGVDDPAVALPSLPHAADSTRCRRCGGTLDYDLVTLGHLGHWRCPSCGMARQVPDVRATDVSLDGIRGVSFRLQTPQGAIDARLPLPGLTNVYNATAAAAAAVSVGVGRQAVSEALAATRPAFGRGEWVELGGRDVILLLAKNPTGANENIRTMLIDPGPVHLLMALNDRTADGHDVSWIWDMDVDGLLPRLGRLTLTGDRAYDLALRFRYDGLPTDIMHVEPDLGAALDAAVASTPAGRVLHLLPTYTAMLDLRALLERRGAVDHFWKDGPRG